MLNGEGGSSAGWLPPACRPNPKLPAREAPAPPSPAAAPIAGHPRLSSQGQAAPPDWRAGPLCRAPRIRRLACAPPRGHTSHVASSCGRASASKSSSLSSSCRAAEVRKRALPAGQHLHYPPTGTRRQRWSPHDRCSAAKAACRVPSGRGTATGWCCSIVCSGPAAAAAEGGRHARAERCREAGGEGGRRPPVALQLAGWGRAAGRLSDIHAVHRSHPHTLAVGRSSLLLRMATVRAAAAVAVVAATAVRGASAWMRMSRRGRLARLLAGR